MCLQPVVDVFDSEFLALNTEVTLRPSEPQDEALLATSVVPTDFRAYVESDSEPCLLPVGLLNFVDSRLSPIYYGRDAKPKSLLQLDFTRTGRTQEAARLAYKEYTEILADLPAAANDLGELVYHTVLLPRYHAITSPSSTLAQHANHPPCDLGSKVGPIQCLIPIFLIHPGPCAAAACPLTATIMRAILLQYRILCRREPRISRPQDLIEWPAAAPIVSALVERLETVSKDCPMQPYSQHFDSKKRYCYPFAIRTSHNNLSDVIYKPCCRQINMTPSPSSKTIKFKGAPEGVDVIRRQTLGKHLQADCHCEL